MSGSRRPGVHDQLLGPLVIKLRVSYRDFRRLAGLLNQPLAAVNGDNYPKPVWHCSIRAAPEDRTLSDQEWARVAAHVMHATGLAPEGDDLGVRWVAVRHAPDHIHLVATLARQDRHRPSLWNTYRKLRTACRDTEEWYGLRSTAPADRTAAKRPTRAETEQAARCRQAEPARVRLRREVCTAAAGARTDDEFFAHLAQAGVLVRRRYSTQNPGEVTGYAVGLPRHTAKDGQAVWYGGGKLAADLTLPKLRARWADPQSRDPLAGAAGLAPPAGRAVLRSTVAAAAEQAAGEMEFFARLRSAGVLRRRGSIGPGMRCWARRWLAGSQQPGRRQFPQPPAHRIHLQPGDIAQQDLGSAAGPRPPARPAPPRHQRRSRQPAPQAAPPAGPATRTAGPARPPLTETARQLSAAQ
jgi:hypothetical protein